MATRAYVLMEQMVECKDLAKRARRLAGTFTDGPDRARLQRYAEELEGQATALEKRADTDPPARRRTATRQPSLA